MGWGSVLAGFPADGWLAPSSPEGSKNLKRSSSPTRQSKKIEIVILKKENFLSGQNMQRKCCCKLMCLLSMPTYKKPVGAEITAPPKEIPGYLWIEENGRKGKKR